MIDHPQKLVIFQLPDGEITGFQADEELHDLLKGLNEEGYFTELSCQDNNGKIWLCFPDWVGQILMEDVFTYSMRSEGYLEDTLFGYIETQAQWTILHSEAVKFISEDEVEGIGELEVSHSLRFPKEDFKKVEKMFLDFLKSCPYPRSF